jgi:hypothetical protein
MTKFNILKPFSIILFLFSNITFAQINNGTKIYKDNKANVYNNQKQKEKLSKKPKTVFSDRDNNETFEKPYNSKVKTRTNIAKALYVIDENEIYYEVVEANEKLIGKPKGLFSFFKSKKFHFTNTKEVKYLGWIKKNTVIEHSQPFQNQENLKFVKYFVATQKIENLLENSKNKYKNEIILKTNPNLENDSKNKIKLNDFVYVYKINKTHNSAFVSNFNNIVSNDTINQKYGWVHLNYITPLVDNLIIKQEVTDSLNINSIKSPISANELYKNTIFLNESQTSKPPKLFKMKKVVLPINIWNHEFNKITNIKGDDISMNTISQIEIENKTINLFYIFDNNYNNKQQLKKLLAVLQNLKITIEKEQFLTYKFTFSFVAKNNETIHLIKSNSFSKWFDLIEKSIKKQEEIDPKYLLKNNNSINQFFNENASFENNFIIIAGSNNSINNLLPNDVSKLILNSFKILFVVLENKNNPEDQNFILQNKAYINEASDRNKKFIQNYHVEQKLIVENDEFIMSDENDNTYIFDAPKKSNFIGGIIFPKLNKEINPKSVNMAIDTILSKTIKTNELHLKSLKEFKKEFSFLRSQPTFRINELIRKTINDTVSFEIPKNYKDEVLLYSTNELLNQNLEKNIFLLMNKSEIKELIDNYRDFISKDYAVEDTNNEMIQSFLKKLKVFTKNKKPISNVNASSTLADLIFNKSCVFVNSLDLHKLNVNDIEKMTDSPNKFKKLFIDLNKKLETLENMFRDDKFEVFNEDAEIKYYFVSKQLLL